MTASRGYLSVVDLQAAVDDPSPVDQGRYQAAIDAASRQIDAWCDQAGTRHFWCSEQPEPRVFFPVNRYLVRPGFIASLEGLVVETDEDHDGVFDTVWDAAEWEAQPMGRPAGEAFDQITATGTRRFPLNGRLQAVRITATYGWLEIPAPVRQACQMLAIALYKTKDFTGGDMGWGSPDGAAGTSVYATARSLVERYQLTPTPTQAVS